MAQVQGEELYLAHSGQEVDDNIDEVVAARGSEANLAAAIAAAVSSVTKQSLGLGNVENKSSATIRSEITAGNISTALGYVPVAAKDLADTEAEGFWVNGYIDTSSSSSHEIVPSANQCTSGMIPTPTGKILLGCSEGYQIEVCWYKNGAYDTFASYRYTPMRSWARADADHCRIVIRKSPTAATSPAEAAANCFWTIPNALENSTTWVSGTINGTTGAESSNSKRIRSSYIPIGTGVKITVPAGIKLLPIMYKDTTPTVEYSLAFQEGSFTMYPQKDTQYLRLVFGYTDDSEITDTGVHAQIRLDYIQTNKKWYALGDSITQGYRSSGSAISVTPHSWANITAKITGLNLRNLGVGGSGYAIAGTQLDQKTAKAHVDDIDFSAADLVTLAYGVNDWKYDATLGSLSSVSGDGTICGNMKYCIEKILDDNPLAKMIIILPLNCWGTTKNYGDYSTNYGLGYAFEHSGTLEQVCDAMKQVAAFYGIEVIDLAHTSTVNRVTLPYCLDDGVHPNIAAHEQLGHEIAARLSYMI